MHHLIQEIDMTIDIGQIAMITEIGDHKVTDIMSLDGKIDLRVEIEAIDSIKGLEILVTIVDQVNSHTGQETSLARTAENATHKSSLLAILPNAIRTKTIITSI